MDPNAGNEFPYSIETLIGEGSFGVVYKCRENKTNKIVAIKVMSKEKMVYKKIAENELKILRELKNLQQKNLLTLFDCIQTDRNVYLIMEYCNFGNLAEYLSAKQRLDEATIRLFFAQVALALEALHRKAIVHRDLKPQNILLHNPHDLVDPLPTKLIVKLADFGFAKSLPESKLTGTFCGSPMYMAPEVIMSHQYGAKADLWSIGTIIYQCLTGKEPHAAQTPQELKILYELNTDLKPNIPDCSPLLANLFKGLLQRNPSDRIEFTAFFLHPFFIMEDQQNILEMQMAEKFNKLLKEIDEIKKKNIELKEQNEGLKALNVKVNDEMKLELSENQQEIDELKALNGKVNDEMKLELSVKQQEIDELKEENGKLKDELKLELSVKQQEIDELKEENGKLKDEMKLELSVKQEEIDELKEENGKLKEEMAKKNGVIVGKNNDDQIAIIGQEYNKGKICELARWKGNSHELYKLSKKTKIFRYEVRIVGVRQNGSEIILTLPSVSDYRIYFRCICSGVYKAFLERIIMTKTNIKSIYYDLQRFFFTLNDINLHSKSKDFLFTADLIGPFIPFEELKNVFDQYKVNITQFPGKNFQITLGDFSTLVNLKDLDQTDTSVEQQFLNIGTSQNIFNEPCNKERQCCSRTLRIL